MGERRISNYLNVHEKYKKVNIINPYRFGGAKTTLKDGLVSVWEFDETTGLTAFDSHGSNNGTNNNATINQSGLINKAYSYNGTSSYISFGSSLFPTDGSAWSFSYWAKLNTTAGSIPVISQYFSSAVGRFQSYNLNGGWKIFIDASPDTNIVIGASSTGWHNVVCTYDGSILRTYLDTVAGPTDSSVNNIATRDTEIGRNGNTANHFNGLIDQVALWYRALTVGEMLLVNNSAAGLAYIDW